MATDTAVQTKYLLSTVTASPSDKGLPSCVISTINADRDMDHVIPEGMDATNFLKAPVLMWSHGGADRYAAIPIGTVTALSVTPGQGIAAEWRWLENDPFADRVRNAWDQGVVRGTSIGFRPKRMEPNAEGGVDHLAWELLELSVCPIPTNPEAVRTLKALGLMDGKALELGDNDKRSRLEAAIQEKYPNDPEEGRWVYLIDVFAGYVIFRDADGKYQRLDYTMDDAGVVSFSGDPVAVAVQYVPMTDEGKAAVAAISSSKSIGEITVTLNADSFKTELATLRAEFDAIQKRGRVLSAVNESRLRAAMDALANANGVLTEVLAQLMPMPDDDEMDDDEHPKPKPMMALDPAETYSLTLAEDSIADGLRLTLADDEVLTFDFIADTPAEPTFSVDPAAMRDVVLAAVRERMQDALVGPVGDAVQRALDRARGRVQ